MDNYKIMQKKAKDFCNQHHILVTPIYIGLVDGFPNTDDKYPHYHFLISVDRLNDNNMIPMYGVKDYFTFEYFSSYQDYLDDKNESKRLGHRKPSLYDLLCEMNLGLYSPIQFGEFIEEFGYQIHSMKDYNIALDAFEGCMDLRKKVKKFFTEEEIKELSEFE